MTMTTETMDELLRRLYEERKNRQEAGAPPAPDLHDATLGQIVDEMERRGFSLHITFSKAPADGGTT